MYKRQSDKSVDGMFEELRSYIRQISNDYLRQAVEYYFVEDEEFIAAFKGHSAAKTVHHGFAGGLLEHTLSVVKMCEYFAGAYALSLIHISSPSTLSKTSPFAESMMIGVEDLARISRHTWYPSIPGSIRSRRIRLG